ncbi:hypothetical protein I215_04950 [Galbibacter marinus]|uniref:DUF983 domain-containing protein n=1 Tax=Galbibacter marinus TaxID=555500 RepID=K2QM23_9FLAO|nr:DUF983 domain-containing protein [Galbibacter marinus]EKF55872.1 hypothetical protein I215_04950 [Galbibacter marinus]
MLKKGSKIYSILTGTCPKCNEGKMYRTKNAYNPSETLKMHEHCSACGFKFQIEPSFFYGAMYVSYGVGIAFAVAAFVISYLFIGTTLKTSFYAIIGTLVAFMPVIMRVSRNIWINLFVKYNPSATNKSEA